MNFIVVFRENSETILPLTKKSGSHFKFLIVCLTFSYKTQETISMFFFIWEIRKQVININEIRCKNKGN